MLGNLFTIEKLKFIEKKVNYIIKKIVGIKKNISHRF
jgi:hypothetical protein